MREEIKKMIAAERKHARELKELRDLRLKTSQQKNPDPKVLKMIDDEITTYLGENHAKTA